MNKKILFIILSLAIILLLILGYLYSLKSGKVVSPRDATPSYPSPSAKSYPTIPTGDKIQIAGVTMDNFYKGKNQIKTNGEVSIVNSSRYAFLYTPDHNFFLISILGSPFPEVRKEAEDLFPKTLGITQVQACKLYVVVSTPFSSNRDYAGKAYRLSFCK